MTSCSLVTCAQLLVFKHADKCAQSTAQLPGIICWMCRTASPKSANCCTVMVCAHTRCQTNCPASMNAGNFDVPTVGAVERVGGCGEGGGGTEGQGRCRWCGASQGFEKLRDEIQYKLAKVMQVKGLVGAGASELSACCTHHHRQTPRPTAVLNTAYIRQMFAYSRFHHCVCMRNAGSPIAYVLRIFAYCRFTHCVYTAYMCVLQVYSLCIYCVYMCTAGGKRGVQHMLDRRAREEDPRTGYQPAAVCQRGRSYPVHARWSH